MPILRIILTLMLVPYLICPPGAFAQSRTTTKHEMLYQRVLSIAEKKAELVNRNLPPGNVLLVKAEKNQAVNQELKKRLEALENASNAEIAAFKKELLKLNEQELTEIGYELRGYMNAMTDAELEALGQVLKGQKTYEEEALEFSSAFTKNEKKVALRNALQRDLSVIRSIYNKKLGMAKKEDLTKDLELNLKTYNAVHATKADNKKLLQISLLVLAGVALATWGISSAVYGARLSRVKSAREEKLTELQNTLNTQYQTYKEQLTKQELDLLRRNGYIRMVCGTFSQPDSILCNRYDYKLFTGQKHCSVSCYKNLDTGKETLHEPAVCSSPFIPTDCYDPKEYWDAYARGEDDGYDDGYYDGESDGEVDGASAGRSDGSSDGYDSGYSDGYSSGYDSGYSSGASSQKARRGIVIPYKKSEEYLRGFRDGLEQFRILFLNY